MKKKEPDRKDFWGCKTEDSRKDQRDTKEDISLACHVRLGVRMCSSTPSHKDYNLST